MVEGDAFTCPALASAICWGESPRATSCLISPMAYSSSASVRSTPALDSRSSASARAWALAAEYSHLHLLEQRRRRLLHPLRQCGHDSSLGQASSGTPRTLSPLPGPLATVRLRATSSATVDGERPRSRAICLHDLPLSRPFWMAARSALSSLR